MIALEAFPTDPEFPQLRLASDPERMLDVFRTRLRPVAGKAYHIEECVPFRFRCRQSSSRCVLQYALRLVEPDTGRRRDQWVTGLVYAGPGEAERLWQELRTADPYRDIPERWLTFEPVAFLPDLDMIVEVFPYDRRLPTLSRVLDGTATRVDPLLLACLAGGQWDVVERGIEPTRYRTELGAALKYTMQARDARTGGTKTVRCYVKVYRDDRGERTLQVLQALRARAEARPVGYSVVAPLAYWRDLRTLVLEEARGVSLQQVLLGNRDPATAVRAVARAVAAFNQDSPAGITRRQDLADQLDDVRLACRLVAWASPELQAAAEAITDAVVRQLADVASPPTPAPIHGDLKADHVFWSGDDVMFIDLDSAALGDPVRDPAHLFAYLAAGVGVEAIPAARARAAATTFAEEYFRHVPRAWRSRFALHCAGALLEVASGIFRRQEPKWREKMAAAVEHAGHLLADG